MFVVKPSIFLSSTQLPTMKFLLIALLLAAALPQATAEVITKGYKIADAEKALTKAKFTKTGLEVRPARADCSLDFWEVDEGVLIISYSTATGIIEGMAFTITDERPKSSRKEYDFAVVSFDTEAGTLVLKIKDHK